MRDLDQLQERDPREEERRLGSIVMATIAFVGLSAAVGVVVGRAARPAETSTAKDPLSELQHGESLKRHLRQEISDAPDVEATSMTFPATLSGEEERPEVLAALAAAAQEEAHLTGDLLDKSTQGPEAAASNVASQAAVASAPISAQHALRHDKPQDPLMAAASPALDVAVGSLAPRGEEGEFTLHVISYEEAADADAFVDALRARGHSAFVAAADVPERGRFYRVRIGPFDSRWRAELYRKKFEQTEQLNTIVVKRSDDEP